MVQDRKTLKSAVLETCCMICLSTEVELCLSFYLDFTPFKRGILLLIELISVYIFIIIFLEIVTMEFGCFKVLHFALAMVEKLVYILRCDYSSPLEVVSDCPSVGLS